MSARRPLLAALAATIYQPTCVILRGVVDQLLFGERPDPLGAASAVAGRIGADPVVALRAIREALVIPYAAVVVAGDRSLPPAARPRTPVLSTSTARADSWWGCAPATWHSPPDDEQVLAADCATAGADLARPGAGPSSSSSPAARPSQRSRRSGAGSVASCTTDWVRGCPGSRSPPTRPAT